MVSPCGHPKENVLLILLASVLILQMTLPHPVSGPLPSVTTLTAGIFRGWESESVFLLRKAVKGALGSHLQRSVGGRGGWMPAPAAAAAVEMVVLCTPTLQHHLSDSAR